MSESAIIKKLKKDPKNLVKFFLQATQSLAWVKKKHSFFGKLILEVTLHVVNKTLSLSSLNIFESCYRRNILESLDVSFDENYFSSLLLMRECSYFRKKMPENPRELPTACEIARHISMKQAIELCKTMVTYDFHPFLKEPCEGIQKLMLQAKEWGYDRGIKGLEELFIDYLDDIGSVFALYLFSTEHDFASLSAYCLKTLQTTELFESFDKAGQRSLSHFELFNDLFSFTENQVLNNRIRRVRFNSFWEYPKSPTGLIIKEVKITFIDGGIEVSQTLFDSADFEQRKDEIKLLNRAPLTREKIKRLTADGRNKVPVPSLCGMLRYFEECSILKLQSYGHVSFDLLNCLSNAKSNLTALLIDDSRIEEKAINQLPVLYPHLKALTINHQDLTKENVANLMNSEIDHLSFAYNRIEIPENLACFSKLLYLGINHVKIPSKSDLKRLFESLTKLRILHAVKTESFDLKDISHPEHLEELMIDCELIEPYRLRNDTKFLNSFQKLALFSVHGSLSSDLKGFFIDCMRERPNVLFKFLTPHVKN
ncbi:MAG: hypothetical protein ACK4HV_04555 [Parachlamydiaceae bacterium]